MVITHLKGFSENDASKWYILKTRNDQRSVEYVRSNCDIYLLQNTPLPSCVMFV